MTTKIDYAKYDKMSQKQLFNAMLSVEKKKQKAALELENLAGLLGYLQDKVISNMKFNELDKAIEEIKNGECETFSNVKEAMESLNA